MQIFHLYYFVTTLAALMFPVWFYARSRRLMSFGTIFPFFFIIYSFVGPLAIIFPGEMENVTRAFYVWDRIYVFQDRPYIYQAHTLYLAFYAAWIIAYLHGTYPHRRGPNYWRSCRADSSGRGAICVPTLTTSLILAYGLCLVLYILVYERFGSVLASGSSVYAAKIGRDPGYQVNTIMKGLFSLCGAAILCATTIYMYKDPNAKRGRGSILALIIAWALLVGMGFLLGDRSQLFVFLIGLVVVFSVLCRPIHLSRGLIVPAIGLLSLNVLIQSFRLYHPSEVISALGARSGDLVSQTLVAPFFSVESFSPYAALPFLIADNTSLVYGYSFYEFVVAFVPRFIAPFRWSPSYSYVVYAEAAGFVGARQGFCMHHVADWYLNLGSIGVLLGGAVVGYMMSMVERKAYRCVTPFWVTAFAMLCGAVPAQLRTPIPGVRAVFYEYWSVPFLLFVVLPYRTTITRRVIGAWRQRAPFRRSALPRTSVRNRVSATPPIVHRTSGAREL